MTADLWAQWRATYDPKQAKRLVEDGFRDEKVYRSAPVRLLVVLKETNSRGGKYDGVRLTDQLGKGAEGTIWHRIAEWAAGFHHGFPPYEQVTGNTVKDEALRRIAVINLKKIPGGSASIESTIDGYAFRDRLLLREQIAALDPEVILACGTFGPMCWLLEPVIAAGTDLGEVVTLDGGTKLIKWDHPARRGKKKHKWYESLKKPGMESLPDKRLLLSR